jgi:hypothetical protein
MNEEGLPVAVLISLSSALKDIPIELWKHRRRWIIEKAGELKERCRLSGTLSSEQTREIALALQREHQPKMAIDHHGH